MKKFTTLLIVWSLILGCSKNQFDSTEETIEIGNEKRTYLLHIPDSLPAKSMLIIALHGGTGQGKHQEEMSGLSTLADKEKYIVAYPNGLHRTWNAGECCGKASSQNVDDVSFIQELIDQLTQKFDIDTNKIFVTGMSNGGFMAYRLAAELSSKIAAIAPVAASSTAPAFNPAHPVSIIHFHSELDQNIPADGGVGDGLSDHFNPPVKDVLNQWAIVDGCSQVDSVVTASYIHYTFTNPNDSSISIQYYLTKDGGHSWPGGNKIRNNADEPSTSIESSMLMVEFFKKHGR